MSTKKRQASENFDTFSVQSNIYNQYAGGEKNLQVGPYLKPICLEGGTFTTDATTARKIGAGAQVAIYNNSASAATARFSELNTVTAGVAGAVDAEGKPSIILKPNDWTYLSSGEDSWLITSAATCLVYIIKDDSYMVNK